MSPRSPTSPGASDAPAGDKGRRIPPQVASLAVAAAAAGERVIALDLDPQASLVRWGKRRKQCNGAHFDSHLHPAQCHALTKRRLRKALALKMPVEKPTKFQRVSYLQTQTVCCRPVQSANVSRREAHRTRHRAAAAARLRAARRLCRGHAGFTPLAHRTSEVCGSRSSAITLSPQPHGDGNRRRQRGLSRSAFLRKQCNGAHVDSHYIRHAVTLSQNADCEKLWREKCRWKSRRGSTACPCIATRIRKRRIVGRCLLRIAASRYRHDLGALQIRRRNLRRRDYPVEYLKFLSWRRCQNGCCFHLCSAP